MRRWFAVLCAFASLAAVAVDGGGDKQIVVMLKAHPVVAAAVRQAQDFSGARSCRYAVARAAPIPQFEPGSAFDFDAEIVCRRGEVAGIVKVSGRYMASMGQQQELRLEIAFAG